MAHAHAHGSGHGHPELPREAVRRALRPVLGLTVAFGLLEAFAGWTFNSLALLADAVHNVSDGAAIAIVILWQAVDRMTGSSESVSGASHHRLLDEAQELLGARFGIVHTTVQIDRDHQRLLQIHRPGCPAAPVSRG